MTYQLCISMKAEEKERLDKVIEFTGLSKIEIFRIGLKHIEQQIKKND